MPHIYRLAREAGMEPQSFCAIDNACFNGPPEGGDATQRPLFTQTNRLPNQLPGGSRVDNHATVDHEFKRDTTLIDKSVNYSTNLHKT